MELRTIQDWIVKRQLSGIPGIVEINIFGGYLKQYEIAIDPNVLSKGKKVEKGERNPKHQGSTLLFFFKMPLSSCFLLRPLASSKILYPLASSCVLLLPLLL